MLAFVIVLVIGNLLQVRRFEYISFETIADAELIGRAPATNERLHFGATMVTEYLIARKDFAIRLHVDPKVMFPHVMVEVGGTSGGSSPMVLASGSVKTWSATGRETGCGEVVGQRSVAEDGSELPSRRVTFHWDRCGETRGATLEFDVLSPLGAVTRERLPFEVKNRGFLLEHSWFGGGVLGWGAPIRENRQGVGEGGRGAPAVVRLMLGPGRWEARP